MLTRTVVLKQEHIDEGQQLDGWKCAWKLAIREACPDCNYVVVEYDDIRLTCRVTGQRLSFATPSIVRKFIGGFDKNKGRVRPGLSFTLRPEEAVVLWTVKPRSLSARTKNATSGKKGHHTPEQIAEWRANKRRPASRVA